MKNFKHINNFTIKNDKLRFTRNWKYGERREGLKAIYALRLNGKTIKIGMSINFFRRMDDYKFQIGHACAHLTPALINLIKQNNCNIELWCREYDFEKELELNGETIRFIPDLFERERYFKNKYSDTIIFD